ncbi:cyclophilin-like fold protein [Salinisphaera sp. SPP-AMP-43]|uniref:cyclophilin-like fold protein n=1 Tax=Salinisphaera sp. SPP-AMP-43 TaxID=3121288 RepID=UPI003C6E5F7F
MTVRIAVASLAAATWTAALFLAGPAAADNTNADPKDNHAMTEIEVTVDGQVLHATLDDSVAAKDFAAMLPLELTLTDFHGIEKVADLPRKLDTSSAPASYRPDTGDITLYAPWGNLAIFYKPFQESRGLVRLGEFDGAIDALIQDGETPIRIEQAD